MLCTLDSGKHSHSKHTVTGSGKVSLSQVTVFHFTVYLTAPGGGKVEQSVGRLLSCIESN